MSRASTTSSSSAREWPASPAPVRSRRRARRRSCSSAPTRSADASGPTSSTASCSTTASRCCRSPTRRRAAALDYDRLELGPFERGAIIRADGRFRRLADPRHAPVRSLRALAGGRRRRARRRRRAPAPARLAATRRRRPRRCGEPASRARRSSASSRPSCAGSSSRSGSRRRAGSSTSCCGRSRTGRRRCRAAGWARSPPQLAEGLEHPQGRRRRHRRAAAPSRSSPASSSAPRPSSSRPPGIVDEPSHGWNGVTCVYYDAPEDADSRARGSSSTARAARSTTSACRARSRRATRRPGARSSRSRSSAPASPTSTQIERQLRGWFGSAVARLAPPADVPDSPRAAGLPGRWLRARSRCASPPGLYACGDHREHPSLNGALASGRRAAEAVLADVSLTATRSIRAAAYSAAVPDEGGRSR